MSPTPAQKAGAALAVLAIAGALAVGSLTPTVSVHGHHVTIPWQATPPAGVSCLRVTALASESALATFGLAADAGPQYVVVRVCAADSDGGEPALPSGMEALSTSETTEAFDGGQPEFEAWAPGTSTPDPSMCACSSGVSCEHLLEDGGWAAAPQHPMALAAGQWRGTGCVPRSCVVISGRGDLVPAACIPDGGP